MERFAQNAEMWNELLQKLPVVQAVLRTLCVNESLLLQDTEVTIGNRVVPRKDFVPCIEICKGFFDEKNPDRNQINGRACTNRYLIIGRISRHKQVGR